MDSPEYEETLVLGVGRPRARLHDDCTPGAGRSGRGQNVEIQKFKGLVSFPRFSFVNISGRCGGLCPCVLLLVIMPQYQISVLCSEVFSSKSYENHM